MIRTFTFAHKHLPKKGLKEITDQLCGRAIAARETDGKIEIVIDGERTRETVQNESVILKIASVLAETSDSDISIFNQDNDRIGVLRFNRTQ